MADRPRGGEPAPAPQVLWEASELGELLPAPTGALWKLAESGRQLDANVVHLPAGERVGTHREPDLDVLLVVLAGGGVVETLAEPLDLSEGTLLWLPRGSTRSLVAGEDGMSYITVHKRRPGMQIRRRP
jgi:quercetin dioxygenase-like cupin family protein